MLIGGVEAGGTKFNCAVYNDQSGEIECQAIITTRNPIETIRQVFDWFESVENDLGQLDAMGLGVFGPLDIDCNSTTFGSIRATNKTGWSNTNIIQHFFNKFKIPIGFNTDVNSAALGEVCFGNNQDVKMLLYVTMGTGIGVSAMYKGKALFKNSHLEAGHILLPELSRNNPHSSCKYHANCWEGFCSGKAIEVRSGLSPSDIPGDHIIWTEVIEHTSIAFYNMMLSLCPDRIIVGGSVTNMGLGGRDLFFQNLFKSVDCYNRKYSTRSLTDNMIQPPSLGEKSGIYGAFHMGVQAYMKNSTGSAKYILINR